MSKDTSVSLRKYVVTKPMQSLSKLGYKATWNNFFTSLDLALHLADQKCCIVGTVRQNKKELPEVGKTK